jgi:ABC-type transporter Mla subunit MlaD
MQQAKWEIRAGLFALGAIIALVWGWAWLKSFSLNPPQSFIARFHDVAGMSTNATVNVQGMRVGTVENMLFVKDDNQQTAIDCHIKITTDSVRVPEGSTISIQTVGLVGAKYVEITLPKVKNPVQPPAQIPEGALVTAPYVQEPARTELIVNRIASKLDDIVGNIDSEAAGHAVNNLSAAADKLNHNMDKLKDAAESVKKASSDIAVTSEKFGKTADSATVATQRASTFFKDGDTTLNKIGDLTGDFKGTSQRLNKLLDNPNFSGDLKETATQARKTAETIRGAMKDLTTTLQDKPLRDQITEALGRLQSSTDNIRHSMEIVNKISGDQGLRNDLKDIVRQAKEALEKADGLLADPNFARDLKTTVVKVRDAATNVDIVSRQMQTVLEKRAPLLHLLFGKGPKPQAVAPSSPTPSPTVAPQPQPPLPGATLR